MQIPKIIHQIWIQGYHHLPDKFKIKHKILKNYNNDYIVILWDDKKIQQLLKKKYESIYNFYNNVQNLNGFVKIYQSKSDIARLIILKEYGGFYIDIDYYCPLHLDEIYNKNDDLVVVASRYEILDTLPLNYYPMHGSSFIGIKKNHELFDILLKKLILQTNRDNIGTLFDKILQNNHFNLKNIDEKYVSPHTCCKTGVCFSPSKSDWFIGRDLLIFLNCKIKKYIVSIASITLIIFLLILFVFHYHY